jgi:hypothetical protein
VGNRDDRPAQAWGQVAKAAGSGRRRRISQEVDVMDTIDMKDTSLVSAAAVKICGEIPSIPRDKTVHVRTEKGSYTFKYAPLETILPFIKPIIAKHECALIQYADDEHVVTELRHKSGQAIATRTRLITAGARNAEYGGALTFARRYGIMLLFSLAADEDLEADPANTTVVPKDNGGDKSGRPDTSSVDPVQAMEYAQAMYRLVTSSGIPGTAEKAAQIHDEINADESLYQAAWDNYKSICKASKLSYGGDKWTALVKSARKEAA